MHSFTSYFKSKKLLLLLVFSALKLPLTYAQQTITGVVTSAGDRASMPGVSVKLKGGQAGASTDVNGKYRIAVPSTNGVLIFSFMGFTTKEVPIKGRTLINVELTEEARSLNEVIVVGYGTTTKKDLTGSVVSVKTKDLPQAANASIDNMLQGRAAGLNLSVRSAQPGGGLNVDIRGGGTPLYVIDGVPLFNNNAPEPSINSGDLGYYGGVDRSPLSSINPADIESVDVLKDASAAAIYGAAAANGVVFITTKKGKAGQMTTEYRGSFTAQNPKDYYNLLNATDFMQESNRFSYDKYLYDNNLAPYGTDNPSSKPVFTPRFTQAQIASAGAGTDWLGMLMRDGSINEHNISISGGNEKTKIFSSFNYYGNKAILNNSDFTRYSGKVNLGQQLGSRVNLNLNLIFSNVNSKNSATGSNNGGQEKYNQLQAAYAFAPTIGVYDTDGTFTRTYDQLITNPAAFLIINDRLKTNRFFASPNIEFKLANGLKLNTVVGVDRQTSTRHFYLPRKAENFQLPEGMAQIASASIGNYSTEAYLTYDKKFTNSNLSIVGGAGYYSSTSENFGLQAVGFFTDAFDYNNVGTATNKEKSFSTSWKDPLRTKLSQFFRVNYNLHEKYLFSVVGRHDGSSYFAENKKWGFFPGVSAAWRIKEEDFLKDIDILSNLKLRVGYGTAGNERVLGTNANDLYGSGPGYVIGTRAYPAVGQIQIGNPDLSWETDVTINAGLDVGLFKSRVNATFDVFRREAKDLLDFIILPSNNAVGLKAANIGETRSDGVEFSLNTNNLVGKFTWNTNFNISSYRSYWQERNPANVLPQYIGEHDRTDQAYGFKTDGIIKSTSEIPSYMPNAKVGNVKYLDVNEDNKLDINDVVTLGNWSPKWSFGFGNTFAFKGLDLNVFLYGKIKQLMSNNYAFLYDPGRLSVNSAQNALVGIKDAWSVQNPSGSLPGYAPNPYAGNNPAGLNDFYLQEVSFIRLRNVTLGYTFSNKLIQKQKVLRGARLFLDIQNLGVATNYKGYDPEFTESNPYPQALSTTFGVNLSF